MILELRISEISLILAILFTIPQALAAITLAANLVTSTPMVPAKLLDTSAVQVAKPDASCIDKECVKQMIIFYADMYGIHPEMALAVAQCESQLKTTAVGDHGLAYGVYQFHESTFDLFKKQFGDESLEYKNTEHQVELALWAISHGKGANWTCYRNLPAKTLALK